MIILSLVSILILWWVYWRIKNRRMIELANKIPAPKEELPLIGVAHMILGKKSHNDVFMLVYAKSFEKEIGEVARIWLGPRLIVGLINPHDIEALLSSNVHLEKSPEYNVFQPWFGNGLLISSGETWKKHRKLIVPSFHLNVLKRFMNQFNIRGKSLVKRMEKENGKEFDCHEYMSECTVETLVETVMGVNENLHPDSKTCHDYAMAVMKVCDVFHSRHLRVWLRSDFLFNFTSLAKKQQQYLSYILNFTKTIFNKKVEDFHNKKFYSALASKEELLEATSPEVTTKDSEENYVFGQSSLLKDDLDDDGVGEKKRLAFLESMIESSSMESGMTDEEIENQVNTLLFEGHDTTAAGSSFFLCVMAARPDIQAKCHEEIDRIFGNSDREITFQDTVEMKFIERCIMETLRMFPPVPVITRQLSSDLKIVTNDIIIPKGATVLVAIFKLHRKIEYYDNPDEFNPDNFLPEKASTRHYYSFIPFSAGPRSCVGRKYAMLKLKILLAHILRKFKITGGQPMKEWKFQGDIILKRSDGFNIRLEPRKAGENTA